MSPRSGRRPGSTDTRDIVLAAARAAFASAGYDATSLRGIARQAGVDPALVIHYFSSKERLFATVMQLPDSLFDRVASLDAEPTTDLGQRVMRLFLSVWEDPAGGQAMTALIRSAVSHDQAATTLRGFMVEVLLGPLAATLDVPDRQLRAGLVASQLVGLAMLRYVVHLEPLCSAGTETLVSWLAPTVQRYFTT